MGTATRKARKTVKNQNLPSKSADATVNRAGGVAMKINDAATKLITMTGGSFFAEPKYYTSEACIPHRGADGLFDALVQRLKIIEDKSATVLTVGACSELDSVAQDVINTAWAVLDGESPRDLFAIAHWLRTEMNIRLTPQVLLVIASRHPAGKAFIREYAPKVIQRADEVKTCILLHKFFFGHKTMKNCLSRGLSDALSKFKEGSLIKYEGANYPSWKDVLMLVHRHKGFPLTKALDEYFRYGRVDSVTTPIAFKRKQLNACTVFDASAKKLVKDSLANWEVVLSQFGTSAESKKVVWEYLVQAGMLGYMATLRNLCNLLKADVSMTTIETVCKKLSDRDEVVRSKQLPFRFAAAYDMVSGVGDCGQKTTTLLDAIEDALDLSCENVPEITGTTAVFADNSGSMRSPVSDKSKVTCAMAANILAGMFAKRSVGDVWVCAFATDIAPVRVTKRTTVSSIREALQRADTCGWCTNAHKIPLWLDANSVSPDRVIVVSDMQCWNSEGSTCMADNWDRYSKKNKKVWLHSVNVCGYGDSMVKDGRRVNLVGSFSEKIMTMLLAAEGLLTGDALSTIEQIRSKY